MHGIYIDSNGREARVTFKEEHLPRLRRKYGESLRVLEHSPELTAAPNSLATVPAYQIGQLLGRGRLTLGSTAGRGGPRQASFKAVVC